MATQTKIGFTVYMNGKLVREVSFDRPIVNVGKLSTSNLRLEDINVSRKHAVIEQRENGQWRVTDLGSTNGTVIRGERVVQADLADGDRIVLGTTTLVVHLGANAQKSAAPATTGKVAAAAGAPAVAAAGARAGAKKGKRSAKPAVPAKPEEIRGLGEGSFYNKVQRDGDGPGMTLEIAMLWGETVLAVKDYRKPQTIVIGEGKGAEFTLPPEALGLSTYDLVVEKGGKFYLKLANSRIKGDVLADGKVQSLDDLRGTTSGDLYPIDRPMRARLKLDEFTLLLSYGQPAKKPTGSFLAGVDYNASIYIALSAIIHIAFLVTLSLIPEDLLKSNRDPRSARERMTRVLRVEPEKDEEKEEEKKEEEKEKEEKEKVEGEEETEGDGLEIKEVEQDVEPMDEEEIEPTEEPPKKLELVDKLNKRKIEKEKVAWQNMSEEDRKAKAKEVSLTTGINKVLADNSNMFDQLMADTEMPTSQRFKALGAASADGDPSVAAAMDPFGGTLSGPTGGFQTVGGAGGGGAPGGGGGPAVAGVFSKTGGGGGGRNLDNLKFKKRAIEPKVIGKPPRVSGALDAATIKRYIRRYLSGIKWCYQDRLQQNRKLRGKLTLAFTILPNGRTAKQKTANSSVRDQKLSSCIVTKMKRWKFPSPKDGGVVEVRYPLILRAQ